MSHLVAGSDDAELDRLINQDIRSIRAMHKMSTQPWSRRPGMF